MARSLCTTERVRSPATVRLRAGRREAGTGTTRSIGTQLHRVLTAPAWLAWQWCTSSPPHSPCPSRLPYKARERALSHVRSLAFDFDR